MPAGNRFVVHELSRDYGERRYAIEDLAIVRDNLVREWRVKGPGRTTIKGIRKPKTGLIWRGTEQEATALCQAMNTASTLGTMTVASDPPKRANAVALARTRAVSRRTAAPTTPSFEKCDACGRMVKKGHQCT